MLNAVVIGGTIEATRDGKALTVGRTAGESGTAVANFTVDTGRAYVRVTVFGGSVEYLEKNLKVGESVICKGSLRSSSATKDGVNMSYVDFVADSFNGVERVFGAGPSINTVLMEGRLCADAEMRAKSASARIAVQRPKRGENSQADFFSLVAFDEKKDELAALKKGERVTVRGHLSISFYEKDGEKRRSTSVVVDEIYPTGAAKAPSQAAPTPTPTPTPAQAAPAPAPAEFADFGDEALPFDV